MGSDYFSQPQVVRLLPQICQLHKQSLDRSIQIEHRQEIWYPPTKPKAGITADNWVEYSDYSNLSQTHSQFFGNPSLLSSNFQPPSRTQSWNNHWRKSHLSEMHVPYSDFMPWKRILKVEESRVFPPPFFPLYFLKKQNVKNRYLFQQKKK